MSTATNPLTANAPAIRPARMLPTVTLAPRVSLGRLIQVELRKLTDTRASRWLLGLVAIGAVGAAVVCALYLPTLNRALGDQKWTNPLSFIALPAMLLPVVAILVFTQEWSQRTCLTTFTLEPRRGLVLAAKGIVVMALGVAGWAAMLALTAASSAIGGALGSLSTDWSMHHWPVTALLVNQLLMMANAGALALLLMNSPAAIALFFVLPNLISAVTIAPGAVGKAASWINFSAAWDKLFTPMSSTDWAKAGLCFVLWIIIPVVIGLIRNLRAEAK